jgi:hypothetical protein
MLLTFSFVIFVGLLSILLESAKNQKRIWVGYSGNKRNNKVGFILLKGIGLVTNQFPAYGF